MPRLQSQAASRPVAWALLSQSIWLPLLAIDLHDRWRDHFQAQVPKPGESRIEGPRLNDQLQALTTPQPLVAAAMAQRDTRGSGLVLSSRSGSAIAQVGSAFSSPGGASSPEPGLIAMRGDSFRSSTSPISPAVPAPNPLVVGNFTRAERLGGPITLADLGKGSLLPLAQAEQGRQSLSGDPLAALPEGWREPMRQALQNLPNSPGSNARWEPARHVHIPSRRIKAATEVPLALQSDGSVDILSQPKEEAVIEEIRSWSTRQSPPAEGHVVPAVVQLHPVEDAQPIRPPQIDQPPVPTANPEPAPASKIPSIEGVVPPQG